MKSIQTCIAALKAGARLARVLQLRVFFGLFLTSFGTLAQAPLDIRIALVIGNAAYVHAPALANPTNDAKSMAVILRKLGFKVIEVIDGNRQQMSDAIVQMQAILKGQQAIGMLYYAGHGLQLDWRNYMVPVSAKLASASDVPKETIDINLVIQSFKDAKTRMNIIVLDACRDNPFEGESSAKGLAQLDAPPGTYLAYATSPGNVAEDGDASSGNGLFTQYLIKELQRPARIEDVFKRVRLQVRQKSEGRQIPWDSSSLEDDFAFNDGSKHTFNPEDLIREAKEKQEKLRAEVAAAKQKEIQIAREQELEKQRLAEAQKKRELEAEAQKQRDIEIARQRELESQRLAEAQKIKDLQARQKAEAESRERERQLAFAADEQKKRAQEAERIRLRAEVETRERESRLALAAELEKQKVLLASLAIEKAKTEEAQRLKELALAKLQAADEAKRQNLSSEEAKEKQFAVEKADWDRIKDSKNAADFYAYLNKYPSGMISEQAIFILENLSKAKIIAQKDKNGIQQIAGEPRFRVGDAWVTAVIDDWTGNEIRRVSSRVTKIEDGLAYIDGGRDGVEIRTLDGAVVQIRTDGGWKFDPPRIDLPGDVLAVGKKWSARVIQTSQQFGSRWREDEFKIISFEEITTPAGTFKTFKLEASSMLQNGTRIKRTYWVEPSWGGSLKASRDVTPPRGGRTRESFVVISLSRGAG